MGDEELKVKITVEGGDRAEKAFDLAEKRLGKMSNAVGILSPRLGNAMRVAGDFGDVIKTLAPKLGMTETAATGMATSLVSMAGPIAAIIAAVGIATVAITGMSKAFAFAMTEAEDAQKVTVQLEAVIKSTGGVAGITSEQIKAMADSLSALSGVDDDLIVSSSNVLLTFTSIGKDVFPKAQETALDLAQAFGMDLQSATVMLGKALQDPAQGMSALSRVGVTFSEQMKESAASLVANGHIAQAQGMILAEVAKQVGGSAEAMGGTVAGESAKIKNLLANMAEDFGKAFLPLKGDLLVIVRQFLTEVTRTTQPAMALLRDSLRDLQTWFRQPEMRAAIQDLSKALASLVGEVTIIGVETLIDGLKSMFVLWKTNGPQTVAFIGKYVEGLVVLAQTLNRIMDLMGKVGAFWGAGAKTMMRTMPGYASGVMNAPGGWAMVGESGPELMQVPRGANIYPSGSAPTASSGGMKIYGPISITAPSDGSLSALMHNLEAAATATA